jgi:hypothetical protein
MSGSRQNKRFDRTPMRFSLNAIDKWDLIDFHHGQASWCILYKWMFSFPCDFTDAADCVQQTK